MPSAQNRHQSLAPVLCGSLFAFVAGLPAQTWAQGAGSSTPAIDLEQLRVDLKDELRDELKDEIKAEIKAELAEEGGDGGGAVQEDAWAEEEWKWEEPIKPELNFLEFDGYFRFRYDMFNKLDLKTYYKNPVDQREWGPFPQGFARPTPLCNTDVEADGCRDRAGESNTLGSSNIRFRLEPVFNVYEDIKIKAQADIMDNMVLGSTPDGFPSNPISPLLAFSQTQNTPSDGINGLRDSIRFKRAWAEVMTPFGQLRVGRMPSHWGMGIMANDGSGLDADFGDTNDRLLFATKIAGFYVVPAFDWTVSGPTSDIRSYPYGQPFDLDQRDDVDQYILAIVKKDSDQEIKEKLENDEMVFNFGMYNVYRVQPLDAADYNTASDPETQSQPSNLIGRDAKAWAYSLWFKFLWRKLTIETEYAGLRGSIGDARLGGRHTERNREGQVIAPPSLSIYQHGLATRLEYKLLRDALTLRLLVVAASGDKAPGWGVRPLLSASGTPGQWDGTQAPAGDNDITNFRFDPNFVVDLILWRQLVGMVTDALVVKPGVQYNLTDGFGARLDFVYSRAWFAESTPSGSITRTIMANGMTAQESDPSNHLGLETDVKLFYDSEDGFHAWLEYGLFIPFRGLDSQVEAPTNPRLRLNASVAHTFQTMLAVSF